MYTMVNGILLMVSSKYDRIKEAEHEFMRPKCSTDIPKDVIYLIDLHHCLKYTIWIIYL